MPERWLVAVEQAGHGEEPREAVGAEAQVVELLMMGLRLAEGVPLARIERIGGRPWHDSVDPGGLARALDAGWLEVSDGRLAATFAGGSGLTACCAPWS